MGGAAFPEAVLGIPPPTVGIRTPVTQRARGHLQLVHSATVDSDSHTCRYCHHDRGDTMMPIRVNGQPAWACRDIHTCGQRTLKGHSNIPDLPR
jgi:hypothetical protein